MEYQCRSVSINKLPVGTDGIIESLCESCQSTDCSNDIEIRTISILGISKKRKALIRGTEASLVVECKGYIPIE
jgi:hypothetical protein